VQVVAVRQGYPHLDDLLSKGHRGVRLACKSNNVSLCPVPLLLFCDSPLHSEV